MTKKFIDFIKVLQYNDKLFNSEDIIKWDKHILYGFISFTFINMCLGDEAPIFMLLWSLIDKKREIKIDANI